ncbi:hypothetical protein SISSUDRAFT_1044813 [Sistotremastrum suecicum HHB10207 ss-3]|uniref:Uncharacterized protein n=1 Tax=Sistotremastrum suecicum HHB10207 ss-3 TaxID=1314776 RepID=A0A166EWF0_9AGAM|nr:hypothetical protein SISSUDRAFT_1044813 [Sistotremastrum suecicum HHB10207 ss-3]
MFKRVRKRQQRKAKEEELGLDDEAKEVLGLNDTDSDESDSSSGKDSDPESGSEAEDSNELPKQDTKASGSSEVDEEENSGSDDESDEDEPLPGHFVSISTALDNPIYELTTTVSSCVTCPGVLLKNPRMIQVHITSNNHTRRAKRFVRTVQANLKGVDVAEEDARLVVQEIDKLIETPAKIPDVKVKHSLPDLRTLTSQHTF